jgi:hypothetical protein
MKKNELGWARDTYGDRRAASSSLVVRSEGRKPLGKPRRRWEDNNKMYFQKVRLRVMGWIGVAQDRDIGIGGRLLLMRQ